MVWREVTFPNGTANEADLAALNAFDNVINSEMRPGDTAISLEQTASRLRPSPDSRSCLWGIRPSAGGPIVATAHTFHFVAEHGRRLMYFNLFVVPGVRRMGLARRLLRRVAETAELVDRPLLQTRTLSTVPAGEAFMERLGARLGRTRYVNQLDVAALDREKLRHWQEAAGRLPSYDIGLWTGSYPEEDLPSMCALHRAAASVRLEGEQLEREDASATPYRMRQREASLRRDERERWTVSVRERDTKTVVGYTEVIWSRLQPEELEQGMTCVLPEHRNRGLGRWLKATMLEAVVRQRPKVKRILTGNATTNAPMLKINAELGFTPRLSRKDWQIDLEQVKTYLGRSSDARTKRAHQDSEGCWPLHGHQG